MDYECIKITLLDIIANMLFIITRISIEYEKDNERKKEWQGMLKDLSDILEKTEEMIRVMCWFDSD